MGGHGNMHASTSLLFIPPDAVAENVQLRNELDNALHLLAERDLENQRERGAVEYELELCQKRNADVVADLEKKLSRCHAENECLKNDLEKLNGSLQHQTSELQARDNRIEQLEAYLIKLPTAEEHGNTLTQLQEMRQRVASLEKSLESSHTQLEQYELRLGELNAQLRRSTEREQLLQTQLDGAMSRLQSKSSSSSSVGSARVTPEFVEDLQFEANRYRVAYDQARKLLEAETHRAEASEARQLMEKRQYKERLAREEANSTGLKASLRTVKSESRQLKKHIHELNSEKQDLLERLLNAKSALSKMHRSWKSVSGRKRARLMRDLKAAVVEVKCLSEHLSRLASGEQLDLSNLLFQPSITPSWFDITDDSPDSFPVESLTIDDTSAASGLEQQILPTFTDLDLTDKLTDEDLNSCVATVQQARETLTELRQRLADRYAEHIGGKLDCRVQ